MYSTILKEIWVSKSPKSSFSAKKAKILSEKNTDNFQASLNKSDDADLQDILVHKI